MPVQITAPLLGSINNAVNLAFNTQLYEAESVYKQYTFDATSEGPSEVYPRLDMLKGIREWIGARQVQSLSEAAFTIANRKFEQTIALGREQIEDDKYGLFSVVAQEMGKTAARYPDLMMAQLMQSGTSTVWTDGQYFFSTAHPGFTNTGAATTVANYAAGSSAGWYLIDNSRALKPFIFQTRIPFSLVTRFNPNDPVVFDNDEFVWGTRGRCNAGFGLWQLCYYSTQTLNQANLIAARTAMSLIRRPDGTPMGIKPTALVVPSSLYPYANSLYADGLVGSDPATPTTLVQNQVRNMFKPIENDWLN